MRPVREYFYSFVVIPLLWIVLRTLGLFDAKVRRGIRGRKDLFPQIEKQVASLAPGKRVWFHSSSMGEFEQAKPIIAELKRRHPELRIIVTFFSPSGYEHSRTYPLADLMCYLPFDTRAGARRFLDIIQPDIAVMVRYDIWPNHIWELHRRNIPVLIANATMRRNTNRRIPIVRGFHRSVYNAINSIMTVSENDVIAFRLFGLNGPAVQAIGDTRFDQVTIRSREARKRSIIPASITQGKKIIVVGSSWPEDEAVIVPAILDLQEAEPNLLVIIAQHEPTEEHLDELERQLNGRVTKIRFSSLNEYQGERIIIVDSIGILLILYASAHIAYVGGSFRQGIHNVLEAAVYGIPVLFGPKHRNSQEPLMLVDKGGAFVVNDSRELRRTLEHLLKDNGACTTAGERAARFVASHTGATERVIQRIEQYL